MSKFADDMVDLLKDHTAWSADGSGSKGLKLRHDATGFELKWNEMGDVYLWTPLIHGQFGWWDRAKLVTAIKELMIAKMRHVPFAVPGEPPVSDGEIVRSIARFNREGGIVAQ